MLTKHIIRVRIVLLLAERLNVQDVVRRAGVSRPAVRRWQHHYGEDGVAGLLGDKTGPPGIRPHRTRAVAEVLAQTCSEPPDAVPHWTGRTVAARIEISLRSAQRIWQAHSLQPHRVCTFKRSHDPAFVEKVDNVGDL